MAGKKNQSIQLKPCMGDLFFSPRAFGDTFLLVLWMHCLFIYYFCQQLRIHPLSTLVMSLLGILVCEGVTGSNTSSDYNGLVGI